MSYSFNEPCTSFENPCLKKDQCTDRAVIAGAIAGIHQMPFGTGHLGSGSIDLSCHNKIVATAEVEGPL